MCLFVSITQGIKPLVAQKDITVYKIIYKDNVSLYKGFPYARNTLYKIHTPFKQDKDRAVYEGFHAYRKRDTAYRLSLRRYFPDSCKLVCFTIPKGAKYFIGDGKCIVSNKIRSGELRPLVGKTR